MIIPNRWLQGGAQFGMLRKCMWRFLTMLVLWLLPTLADPIRAAEKPMPQLEADSLHGRLSAMLAGLRTATWRQSIWQWKGSDEEYVKSDCYWEAPDHVRVEVLEGRGKNSIAIYRDGKVTGYKKGLLSFAKLTFDPRDAQVKALRGQDIRGNGFFDELRLAVQQWRSGQVVLDGPHAIVPFTNSEGLPAKLWIRTDSLFVERIEAWENGKLAERQIYEQIRLNPPLDSSLFVPK